MEEKRQEQRPQYFYFNEDGKLVVESNKGVWVDGTPYVKMYGNFSCNAKTMGQIIAMVKGISVEILPIFPVVYCNEHPICTVIVNPSEDDKNFMSEIKGCRERIKELTQDRDNMKESSYKLKKQLSEFESTNAKMLKSIHDFNALPWYKRMFKKIEIE